MRRREREERPCSICSQLRGVCVCVCVCLRCVWPSVLSAVSPQCLTSTVIYDSSQDIALRRVVFASLPVPGRLKELLKMQLFSVSTQDGKTPGGQIILFQGTGRLYSPVGAVLFFFCPFSSWYWTALKQLTFHLVQASPGRRERASKAQSSFVWKQPPASSPLGPSDHCCLVMMH